MDAYTDGTSYFAEDGFVIRGVGRVPEESRERARMRLISGADVTHKLPSVMSHPNAGGTLQRKSLKTAYRARRDKIRNLNLCAGLVSTCQEQARTPLDKPGQIAEQPICVHI